MLAHMFEYEELAHLLLASHIASAKGPNGVEPHCFHDVYLPYDGTLLKVFVARRGTSHDVTAILPPSKHYAYKIMEQ